MSFGYGNQGATKNFLQKQYTKNLEKELAEREARRLAAIEANAIGQSREAKVAQLLGDVVDRTKIRSPFVTTDIDVIAANGDLVMVGGPAKARNLSKLAQTIMGYQWEAQQRGVGVQAMFTSNTPQNVLDFAAQRLGAANVKTFTE